METFAVDNSPFYQCFVFFADGIGSIWSKLESVVLYQGVTLGRVIVGFIILSALIGVFWRGVKG